MGEIEPTEVTNLTNTTPGDTARQVAKSLGTGEAFSEITDANKETSEQLDGSKVFSPLEEIQAGLWESERNNLIIKTKFWKMLYQFVPVVISIIVILIGVFVGIFTYRISNLSEPIGYIKSDTDNLKINFNEYKIQNEASATEIKNQITEERRQRENADAKK